MSQIIKKRIIPILLLVVLCFGMVPTAFAEAEITTIDTSTVTQTDVQGKPDTDITVVPNEDAGDLITDEGPDSGPVDESTSSSTDFSSTSSSEVHTPSNLEAASSSSVSSDNTVSSTTATYISKKCGMVTVRTNSTVSPQLPPLSFLSSGASANRYSQSRSEAQRPLMLPDEVEHMDKARCLALISGRRPVMLYKLIPEELPGFDKMGLVKISDYKPHWKEKDDQYQKAAAAPQVYIPSVDSRSAPCRPLSHPAFRADGTSQLQIPMEPRETCHYELPRQQKKPSPAAEDRVGNMRRYTAQEVLAQTRCKAASNTGENTAPKKG